MARRQLYNAAVLVALALGACSNPTTPPAPAVFQEPPPAPMPHAAKVPTQPRPAPEGLVRVRITPEAVIVDGRFLRSAYERLDRERLAEVQTEVARMGLQQGLVREGDMRGGFLVEPLFELLTEQHMLARTAARLQEDADPEEVGGFWGLAPGEVKELPLMPQGLLLEVDERIPYKTLASVLYTAGQAEFSTYFFVVSGRDGRLGALRFEAPKFRIGGFAIQEDDATPCVQPVVHVLERGVLMRAHAATSGGAIFVRGADSDLLSDPKLDGLFGDDGAEVGRGGLGLGGGGGEEVAREEAPEPTPKPEPKPRGADDACAWIPDTTDSSPSLEGYRGRLERLTGLGELCETQTLIASEMTRWGRVAPIVAIGEGLGVWSMFAVGEVASSCEGESWWPDGEPVE